MAVPAAKVKALCTDAESALVRASRRPALGQLTPPEVKRHAARAKKLADKWAALSRDQSRTQARQSGFGDSAANTELKAEIFRDALANFTARLGALEAAGESKGTAKSAKSKKRRSAGHRTERSAVRKELKTEKRQRNADAAKKATRAPASTGATSTPTAKTKKVAGKTPAPKAAKPKPAKKKSAKKAAAPPLAAGAPQEGVPGPTTLQQLAAKTAAKQSRVRRSGLSSRVRGHVSARGRRKQAARDQRN